MNPPIFHSDNSLRVSGHVRLVRDHDDGLSAAMQLVKKREDFLAGSAVEISGGFVGQKNGRPCNQGSGDRHALPLAAGKLIGPVTHAI